MLTKSQMKSLLAKLKAIVRPYETVAFSTSVSAYGFGMLYAYVCKDEDGESKSCHINDSFSMEESLAAIQKFRESLDS